MKEKETKLYTTAYAYQTEWARKNTRRIMLKINKNKYSDIVDWLDSKPNKQSYIMSLIEADMSKSKKEE